MKYIIILSIILISIIGCKKEDVNKKNCWECEMVQSTNGCIYNTYSNDRCDVTEKEIRQMEIDYSNYGIDSYNNRYDNVYTCYKKN